VKNVRVLTFFICRWYNNNVKTDRSFNAQRGLFFFRANFDKTGPGPVLKHIRKSPGHHGDNSMNVNVIYYSRGGNTKKVAEVVAQECGVEAIDIAERHVLPETDLLFIGMGIYAGRPDHVLLDYLDQLPANRVKGAALFTTSATGKDRTELILNLLTHKGITPYKIHCNCKGRFLLKNKGRPNEVDFEEARNFTRRVLRAFNG
jgi:flavodoxin I